MHRSTFSPLQDANPTPSFGGFGLSSMFIRSPTCCVMNSPPGRMMRHSSVACELLVTVNHQVELAVVQWKGMVGLHWNHGDP